MIILLSVLPYQSHDFLLENAEMKHIMLFRFVCSRKVYLDSNANCSFSRFRNVLVYNCFSINVTKQIVAQITSYSGCFKTSITTKNGKENKFCNDYSDVL